MALYLLKAIVMIGVGEDMTIQIEMRKILDCMIH